MDNKLVRVFCQFTLKQEQLYNLLKENRLYIKNNTEAANDAIFDLSTLQYVKKYYTARELATILGLNCSNDVEYLVKILGLKTSKYGKWGDNKESLNSLSQFYYNQIALKCLVRYLTLIGTKVS